MNEIRLVYFGNIIDLNGNLLLLLNVVEVRPENELQKGFFIFETRFGQQTVRSLSLDLCDFEARDILIFRYLSEAELQALRESSQQRRYFVLLHGFFSLDYVVRELKSGDFAQLNFLVDMTSSESFKPFAYVNRQISSKNFYRIVKAKAEDKAVQNSKRSWSLPLFVLVLVKVLINPINEIKRLAVIAKHSNLRVISRLLELLLFIDFVIRAVLVTAVHVLGLNLFYKSAFVAGVIRVGSIKAAYFFRHIVLISIYKLFGFAVDGFNLIVRAKDFFVTTLYYRFLHKLYYRCLQVIYKSAFLAGVIRVVSIKTAYFFRHIVLISIYKLFGFAVDGFNLIVRAKDFFVIKLYYRFLHRLYHAVVKKLVDFLLYKFIYVIYFHYFVAFFNASKFYVYVLIRYKVPHYLTMAYYRGYGLVYDAGTASYRFTKLILLYPFFKVFWFCRFQYEKRLKRFLL